MKRVFYILFYCCLAIPGAMQAQVLTEGDVIETLMRSLQNKDSRSYIDLFPRTDSIAAWVLQYADKESDAYKRMLYLQENYGARLDYDSSIQVEADKGFTDFQRKGTALGIHWDQIVFVRYELEKLRRGRGLLHERIAPLRFLGYVFIKDMLTRKVFALTVFDIMQVNGFWYGGELANVFEASTKEEYQEELAVERKKLRMKELGIIDTTEDRTARNSYDEDADIRMPKMKEILDRKFYKGSFDNEITVQLYVRHIKGGCPEVICAWDALFKFGDQDEYVQMEVSRSADGKWLFTEELGGMELVLNGSVYSGSYASSSDKTEYDVKLVETPISLRKVQALDETLDLPPAED